MFRKSCKEDCKQIYNLICDMENTKLPYDRFCKIYLEQLNQNNMYCLVNVIDDEVIAFINLRFEMQLHHCSSIAEIMEFVVKQEFRNKGVGKEILQKANQIAIEHGCSQIEVACNQLRLNTHRFYEREGMHNFHYKFSKKLLGIDDGNNALGK